MALGKNLFIKNVLIAPLDWGLGHATRCLVIVKYLQNAGCKILIACNAVQKALFVKEFPDALFIELTGYNISYHENKRGMAWKILWQVPKIFSAIRKENKWLNKIVDENKIDLVIADNRYGLYSEKCICIFMTHQLQIKAPFKWMESWIHRLNYQYINKFDYCWVPDVAGVENFAGELSHPSKLPRIPVIYIGALSRFDIQECKEKKYEYLAIISGPEPQRSILEKKILQAAEKMNERFLIVRGKPGSDQSVAVPTNCVWVNHLTTTALETAIAESEFIISRSGYTTIMELMPAGIKTIMIPTPGQTEQEYLAEHLMQKKKVYYFKQEEDFIFHLRQAAAFEYSFVEMNDSKTAEVLDDFFRKLQ